MKQIFVNVEDYEGTIFDHKLVAEGEPIQGCVVVEVSEEELKELDEWQAIACKYETRINELYARAVEKAMKATMVETCKFRLRPGKFCGEPVKKKGTDRCAAHVGQKNKSNKLEAFIEEEE